MPTVLRNNWCRCRVRSIERIDTDGGLLVRLAVVCEDPPYSRIINLWSQWAQLPVSEDDYLHAIGTFSARKGDSVVLDVTFGKNAVIVHPDILVAVTAITESMTCTRRSILRSLIRFGPGVKANRVSDASYGALLHSVVQRCMEAGSRVDSAASWTTAAVRDIVRIELSTAAGQEACFRSGETQETLEIEMMSRLSCLPGFGTMYFGQSPKVDAWVDAVNAQQDSYRVSITGIRDIERDVQSVALGIRGRADVLVDVALITKGAIPNHMFSQDGMSLELKTGAARHDKPYASDCAQTLLYTMILSEETERPLQAGLLFYSRIGKLWLVPGGWNEVRDLLCQRNEVAGWLARKDDVSRHAMEWTTACLPPPIDDAICCEKCRVVDACMLYSRVSGSYAAPSMDMEDLYKRKTNHLDFPGGVFLNHWSMLLLLEEAHGTASSMPSWILCANVDADYTPQDGPLTVRFSLADGSPFPDGECVTQGDAITVTLSSSPLAIARAHVVIASLGVIEARVSHFCGTGAGLVDWRVFDSINRYRISRDGTHISHGVARGNLVRLFGTHQPDLARRKVIVHLEAPRFGPIIPHQTDALLHFLNAPQRAAVDLVLAAKDYALIRGMPGTGKTTLIVALLGELVRRGKTVLITGHTHSSVDNILSKLIDSTYDIVRLGRIDKIHSSVHKFCLSDGASAAETAAFARKSMAAPVVATTCLSLNHPTLSRRMFDYSIVDEASQVTVPASLGPLRLCKVLVLVGDDHQLPPMVRSEEARSRGLGVSLFQTLFEHHPMASVDLTVQYRMSSNIMSICNGLTYESRMVSGSTETSSRKFRLSGPGHPLPEAESGWVTDILQENLTAVFVDTDGIPGIETAEGSSMWNDVEATLVVSLVSSITRRGGQQCDTCVITPYRRQLESLSEALSIPFPDVDLLTIDTSQGREKECVVVSLVRSNDRQDIGSLIGDSRRLNVAFTRARSKLIVIGSRQTLVASPYMRNFIDHMDVRGWTRSLSPTAAEA